MRPNPPRIQTKKTQTPERSVPQMIAPTVRDGLLPILLFYYFTPATEGCECQVLLGTARQCASDCGLLRAMTDRETAAACAPSPGDFAVRQCLLKCIESLVRDGCCAQGELFEIRQAAKVNKASICNLRIPKRQSR